MKIESLIKIGTHKCSCSTKTISKHIPVQHVTSIVDKIKILTRKWLFTSIRVFGSYYSTIQIIFDLKHFTIYQIEYYSKQLFIVRIIRTIR